ncbi:hypothetical protein PXK58_08945 [Phaeobacter gallaeciensis]|nr:hypothetical protein [Phaeobacter gallaeciensis]MDE4274748.1 hypothetical protein [Phaeobacter gallaeciensis]MDE4299678.1 hypothetical protein [Phaeobacter gallaeciensis]MDE5184843.1 hypothetical protein [Phaeobacter gallaeciensis]
MMGYLEAIVGAFFIGCIIAAVLLPVFVIAALIVWASERLDK